MIGTEAEMAASRQEYPRLVTREERAVRQSVGERVFETLREWILAQRLLPGEHLTESALAKEFNVSATPIREALHKLVFCGLADRETSRGVRIRRMTIHDIHEVFELRALLEPAALLDSARSMTETDWLALEDVLKQAREAIESDRLADLAILNGHFHKGLVEKAENRLMLEWLNALNDRRNLISLRGWMVAGRTDMTEWNEHSAVVAAGRGGELEKSSELLKAHIVRSMNGLLEASRRIGF